MILLNQTDPRFANVKMLPSNITIGRAGCLLCSLCMLSDYFGEFVLPQQAIGQQVFFNKSGYVIWEKLNFSKFKLEKRIRNYDKLEVKMSIKDPKRAVCLNVNNGSHWVVAVKALPGDYYWCYDPYGGKRKLYKGSQISGSANIISKF